MPSSNSTSDSNVDHCRIAPADRSSNHRCDFRPSSWNYDVMYPREERADFGGLADIERREAGIIVHLRRSKTDQVAAGHLKITVHATAPLTHALPLIHDLYDRRVTGKVVITS